MKTYCFIICSIFISNVVAFAQTHKAATASAYKKIPDSLRYKEKLIKYVKPDKNYTYWEFDEGEMDTTKSGHVIFSSGTKPEGIVIKDPQGSLFAGCLPAFCYKYIAYVYNGKVGYITSNIDFISFMGSIDNLQEAILLAQILDDVYPDTDKRGAGYLITPAGYRLVLTKYNLCPESKQAIKITIDTKGIIKKEPGVVFYKTTGCAVI